MYHKTNKRHNPYYQAQAILSRRDHSIFEVQTKMKRKGFTIDQINNAITKLKKLKLLDDRSFAHKYAKEILLFKAVGPRWLGHKLRQKGIDKKLIDEAITAAYANGREAELAQQAAQKWQQLHSQHKSDQQRLARFLISRGFTPDIISCYLDTLP